jgi:hypothetical protein
MAPTYSPATSRRRRGRKTCRCCVVCVRVTTERNGISKESTASSCRVKQILHGSDISILDRLCGLEVRVPGYRTELYCVSCEVRDEFIYVM